MDNNNNNKEQSINTDLGDGEGFLSSSKKDKSKEDGGKEQSLSVGLAKQVKNIEGKVLERDGKPLKSILKRSKVVADNVIIGVQPPDVTSNTSAPKEVTPLTTMEGDNMHDSIPVVNLVRDDAINRPGDETTDKHDNKGDSAIPNAMDDVTNGAPKTAPVSFASIINSQQAKTVNFRSLLNDEKSLAFPVVQSYVNNIWGKFGLQKPMKNDDGVYLFKFSSSAGIEKVLERGPWMIRKSPIILTKWSPSLSLRKVEVTKVPVWVKLHGVHVFAYSDNGLSLIATQIGKPIMLDAFTSSMYVESWGRISFAHALIEVSVNSVLKKEVVMATPNEEDEGYTREVIRVEEVSLKDPTRAPKSTFVEENKDGFVQVKSRKTKKKTGQGSGINLSKCNPNFQYRPVSQPRKGKCEASKETTGPKKGSVNDNGNVNSDFVSLKNSFANPIEEDSALDEGQNASKEASSSKSKFTSLDCDDDSNDDEEVYMLDGMLGGGSMDGLEDDLDCFDGYGTQVYDLTPQEQAFYDQYEIRLNSHDTYNNLFSVKMHYGGRFTDSPNKQYVDGEVCFVDMLDIYDFKVDLLNTFMCSLGYEDDDELLLYYKIPLKIEKTESSGDEDGQSDSESEDANDLVNEEHLVEEVEVNMNKFNFQLDGEDETDFIDHIQSHVNVTEDDLEVLDFDSLESEQEDVPENARSRVLRKLRKKHMAFFEKGKGIMQDAKEDKLSYPWLLYLSKGDKSKWLVKTFKDEHKCLQSRQIKHCTSNFLSKQITDLITMNPQIPIKAIQEQMQKKYHVYVSKHKSFRAKAKTQVHLRGDVEIQYSLLWDYANELQKCNPDTTVKIDVYGEEDHEKPTRMFKRIYVCLGALKRGFKESGRELLGLDGAFMRGQYSGQMLTAVGMDANNGIYPIAYGIVESENQYSWTWFLTCLGDDFDLYTNSNFTFITDRQKGLVPTIAKLFPAAEHRFEKNMAELKNYNKKAHEWLSKIPPEHWSRAYFSGRAHCDLLINNLCEVFNRQLLDARDSQIITSLEYVREYLIKRIVIVKKIIEKSDGPLTPAVTKVFNKIKEAASRCSVDWNGSDLFQVKGPYQDQCVVNMNQKTCSCKKWEISGIPCKHAIAAIHDMADNGMDVGTPEDWVHESYKLQTWMNVYAHKINPINRRDMWSKFECLTTLLPPKKAPQIGRPPKNRKKSKCEIAMVKGHKLTRKGKTVTCSNYKGIGHNKRGCKGIGSSGGQMFDMSTTAVGSQLVASQAVPQRGVGVSTWPPTPSSISDQRYRNAGHGVNAGPHGVMVPRALSQPVSRQTRSRGPVASQPLSSQTVARKQVARKHVQAFKSSQPASGKRPASQINEPASQASQSSQPASQASRLPTSPMKRTKMTAYRLTPDS
ncbi:mutator type transposase [Tanacetum coccineum]